MENKKEKGKKEIQKKKNLWGEKILSEKELLLSTKEEAKKK